MAYDLLPMIILLACGVGLAVMVGKKLPQLKTLDVASIPAERERQLKQRLLATRLRRRLQALVRLLAALARPVVRRLVYWLHRWYRRILELESKHRRPAAAAPAQATADDLTAAVAEAQALQAQGQTAAAEEKLMRVVANEPRHAVAYDRLGSLYLETRDYAKAREVYSYLLKLLRRNPPAKAPVSVRLADVYFNLARADLELGSKAQALHAARKAATLEPSNPRVLDFLLKISILVKDKPLATQTWEALRQADPENAKLAELRQQIDALP